MCRISDWFKFLVLVILVYKYFVNFFLLQGVTFFYNVCFPPASSSPPPFSLNPKS
jgi:hypothetical protein